MSRLSWDVVVIGGGHAGSEAAMAASRLGARVLLLTTNLETIGQMSCNPAIGGIAKGTVVREVDAFGGVMGRAADRASIQFRMLNRSKGPAVWSPRSQCDRGLYRRAVREILEENQRIDFMQGTAAHLVLEGDRVTGVQTTDGRKIEARAVVLTAGTFLRGKIHIGTETRVAGGRAGEAAVRDIAEQLEELGLEVRRFKTGTPPRVDGRSVDYTKLERQDGEGSAYRFGHYRREAAQLQVPCWITWAGAGVKEIIEDALNRSALYGGTIAGRGPRYCPSIEDKIVKFPNAERHQIFLEPEGLATSELYVNGLSTSLPVDVQLEFLSRVPGLEQARLTRPGYAIEYDYYSPEQLHPWLEVKSIGGLFFAGQVNGTTGYEEAAGQGLIAGINAARSGSGDEPVVIGRNEGYIGVLVDDLVTRGVDEPYRLFTSRSEFRLSLRQDNALDRLGPVAAELGMLSDDERRVLDDKCRGLEELRTRAASGSVSPEVANPLLERWGEAPIEQAVKVKELARRPGARLDELLSETGMDPGGYSDGVLVTAGIELKYEGYLERERLQAEKRAQMAEFSLPADLDYLAMRALSTEARQKLDRVRPRSLGQAGRIPGVSQSDLQNLIVEVLRKRSVA